MERGKAFALAGAVTISALAGATAFGATVGALGFAAGSPAPEPAAAKAAISAPRIVHLPGRTTPTPGGAEGVASSSTSRGANVAAPPSTPSTTVADGPKVSADSAEEPTTEPSTLAPTTTTIPVAHDDRGGEPETERPEAPEVERPETPENDG